MVADKANAFYFGVSDLVVLTISVERLEARVLYEGGAVKYPHIYGPLPVAAVVAAEPLTTAGDGTMRFGK